MSHEPGWLDRQARKSEEESKTWPGWMRRAAGLPDPPPTKDANGGWLRYPDHQPAHLQDVIFRVEPFADRPADDRTNQHAGRMLGGRYVADGFTGFGIPGIGGLPVTWWRPMPDGPPKEFER